MIHIPQLTGLFDPVPFKEDPNADQNNLSTIGALQDPQGTLERKQAEQIAKASAGIKMEGIDQKYKGLAIDAIDEFQKKSKSMYAQNKGFNRLKLNAKQLLDEQHNYNELLTNINALKQLTADNRKTLEDVDNAVASGTITREDYDAFEKARLEAEEKTKSIGDIPSYRALLNNYLGSKPYDWTQMNKDWSAAIEKAPAYKDVQKVGEERYNVVTKDPIPVAENMFNYNPKLRKFWLEQFGGNEELAKKAFFDFASKDKRDDRSWGGNVSHSGDSFWEWKRKFDYTQGAKSTKNAGVIPRDSDAGGYVWDISALPVKLKWTGAGYDGEKNNIALKNADIVSIHSDGKRAYMTVMGQSPGDTKGPVNILDVPVTRSVLLNLKKMGYKLDGWDSPLSGEYGENPEPPSGPYNKKKETEAQKLGL